MNLKFSLAISYIVCFLAFAVVLVIKAIQGYRGGELFKVSVV